MLNGNLLALVLVFSIFVNCDGLSCIIEEKIIYLITMKFIQSCYGKGSKLMKLLLDRIEELAGEFMIDLLNNFI